MPVNLMCWGNYLRGRMTRQQLQLLLPVFKLRSFWEAVNFVRKINRDEFVTITMKIENARSKGVTRSAL
ncbi:MAG: hypothetical protein ACI90V_005186 [Bacillariaceae sp.]|jgi:hypothetical protein